MVKQWTCVEHNALYTYVVTIDSLDTIHFHQYIQIEDSRGGTRGVKYEGGGGRI